MKKNRAIPAIPNQTGSVPTSTKPVEVETAPVSGLTKQALQLLQERHQTACEAVAQEASKLEGKLEKDGWKLDLSVLLWFRPKPKVAK